MIVSSLDHIILYSLLFSLFLVFGIYANKIQDSLTYWLCVSILILSFSIIVGSRYGWGPDYHAYNFLFDNVSWVTGKNYEFGYQLFLHTASFLGFDSWGIFLLISALNITCALILIRSYKDQSLYTYVLVVPAILLLVTFAVRQGLGLSFYLVSILFLNRKKYIQALIFVFIGGSIHYSIFYTSFVTAVFYFFLHKPFNYKITIPVYIFVAFFYDPKATANISNYVKLVPSPYRFQNYVQNSGEWFGSKALNPIYQQSDLALVLTSLFYISIIYLGYKSQKISPKRSIAYIYNLLVFGIISYRMGFLYEILRRLTEPFLMLYFIVLGNSIATIFQYEKTNIAFTIRRNLRFMSISAIVSIGFILVAFTYLMLFWGRFIITNPNSLFRWST